MHCCYAFPERCFYGFTLLPAKMWVKMFFFFFLLSTPQTNKHSRQQEHLPDCSFPRLGRFLRDQNDAMVSTEASTTPSGPETVKSAPAALDFKSAALKEPSLSDRNTNTHASVCCEHFCCAQRVRFLALNTTVPVSVLLCLSYSIGCFTRHGSSLSTFWIKWKLKQVVPFFSPSPHYYYYTEILKCCFLRFRVANRPLKYRIVPDLTMKWCVPF